MGELEGGNGEIGIWLGRTAERMVEGEIRLGLD